MLTVVQITALHIARAADLVNSLRNRSRLEQTLQAVHALKPRPDVMVISGDLADTAAPEEYRALREILRGCEIPIYAGVGNHDARAPFMESFGASFARLDDHGFVQYAVDLGGLRLLMGDTLDEGRDGGAYCEARAAWLKRMLDQAPQTPTLLFLHHPPVLSGIQWMDPAPDEPWIVRLREALQDRPQVKAVACGHIHRAFHKAFAGQIVSGAPATSIQLTLDLRPVDMGVPDGREILVEEPPGFMLHCWDGAELTSHVGVAGAFKPAVAYTVPFRS